MPMIYNAPVIYIFKYTIMKILHESNSKVNTLKSVQICKYVYVYIYEKSQRELERCWKLLLLLLILHPKEKIYIYMNSFNAKTDIRKFQGFWSKSIIKLSNIKPFQWYTSLVTKQGIFLRLLISPYPFKRLDFSKFWFTPSMSPCQVALGYNLWWHSVQIQ